MIIIKSDIKKKGKNVAKEGSNRRTNENRFSILGIQWVITASIIFRNKQMEPPNSPYTTKIKYKNESGARKINKWRVHKSPPEIRALTSSIGFSYRLSNRIPPSQNSNEESKLIFSKAINKNPKNAAKPSIIIRLQINLNPVSFLKPQQQQIEYQSL